MSENKDFTRSYCIEFWRGPRKTSGSVPGPTYAWLNGFERGVVESGGGAYFEIFGGLDKGGEEFVCDTFLDEYAFEGETDLERQMLEGMDF